jgi:hypothetical protein
MYWSTETSLRRQTPVSMPVPGRASVSFQNPSERTSSASTSRLDSSFQDSNSTTDNSQHSMNHDNDNDNTADNADDSSDDMNDYTPNLQYLHKNPPLPPSPLMNDPMSPERRARKQRLRPCASRRGGACHSDLLKSAVLATLESYESEPESADQHRSASASLTGDERSRGMDDNSRSSRKRARQQWDDCHEYENLQEQSDSLDDCLLGAMDVCTISTRASLISHFNPPLVTTAIDDNSKHSSNTNTNHTISQQQHPFVPVRHVARRTSKELASGMVPSPRTKGERQRHMRFDH